MRIRLIEFTRRENFEEKGLSKDYLREKIQGKGFSRDTPLSYFRLLSHIPSPFLPSLYLSISLSSFFLISLFHGLLTFRALPLSMGEARFKYEEGLRAKGDDEKTYFCHDCVRGR